MRVRAQLGCAGILAVVGVLFVVLPVDAVAQRPMRVSGAVPALLGAAWLSRLVLRYRSVVRKRLGGQVLSVLVLLAGAGLGLAAVSALCGWEPWWRGGVVLTETVLAVLGVVLATTAPG